MVDEIIREDAYGYELVLDLHNIDIEKCTREGVEQYLIELCDMIDMQRIKLHFWDYEGVPEEEIPYESPHLIGVSAVQFISTSNITIHTLTMLKKIFVNIFTCKPFDQKVAEKFTKEYFSGEVVNSTFLVRR